MTVTCASNCATAPAANAEVVRIDAEQPAVEITSLKNGDFLRRAPGGTTLIVGGLSSDVTSWVEQVDVNTGTGFATRQRP